MSKSVAVATYVCRHCRSEFSKGITQREMPEPRYVKQWMRHNMVEFHTCGVSGERTTGVGELTNVYTCP